MSTPFWLAPTPLTFQKHAITSKSVTIKARSFTKSQPLLNEIAFKPTNARPQRLRVRQCVVECLGLLCKTH
jgi:hypothetical protein